MDGKSAVLAVGITLALLSPVRAQDGAGQYVETPGGLVLNPQAAYRQAQRSFISTTPTVVHRRTYATTVYSVDPSTGTTSTAPGFDFQAFVDDIGLRFQTMIGQVAPLLLLVILPLLGFIFLMKVVKMLGA